jgi:hypothetical protein
MKKIMQKLRLYRIMRLGYGIRWRDVSKGRRKYYLWLYKNGDYEKLHQCLYSLSKGDIYEDMGWEHYIFKDGRLNTKTTQKAKGAK